MSEKHHPVPPVFPASGKATLPRLLAPDSRRPADPAAESFQVVTTEERIAAMPGPLRGAFRLAYHLLSPGSNSDK